MSTRVVLMWRTLHLRSNVDHMGDETYTLALTPAETKVTWTALQTFYDGLGHDEHALRAVVRQALDKLPDRETVDAIDLGPIVGRH
jgi:hypothetical protein